MSSHVEPPLHNDPRADGGSSEPQLNGWKDIAAHFGKGVRTVQRWEREIGLPVHRLPGPRGEIVFAFPSELRSWREKLEQDGRNGSTGQETGQVAEEAALETEGRAGSPVEGTPSAFRLPRAFPSRRHLVAALVIVSIVTPAAAVAFRLLVNRQHSRPAGATVLTGPAGGEVRQNALVTFDERGTPLWSHRFENPLEAAYADPLTLSLLLAFADIDGDGRVETLFFAVHPTPQASTLYCFESNGDIRFTRTLDSLHTYGNEAFTGPWRGFRLLTHEATLRSGEIWITWIHGIEFPSVLERLDVRGKVVGQFWNDGYITSAVPVVQGARRLMLVGGTNNEFKTAFLAVTDRGFTGFSPAVRDKYACKNCAGKHPERYLVFPRLDVSDVQGCLSSVQRIEPDAAGQTMVAVNQSLINTPAEIYYRFDRDFNLIRAEFGPRFAVVHQQLERQRLLLHPFGASDDQAARAVRAWDGTQFSAGTGAVSQH